MIYDLAILGGGAAGLMASSFLDYNIKSVLIEHNQTLGKKIAISGGGKCNVTNQEIDVGHYLTSNKEKAEKILNNFSNDDLLRWLKQKGCRPVARKKGQYFCPHSSSELLDIFKNTITSQLLLGYEIEDVVFQGNYFHIKTNITPIMAKNVLVATGGISYKKIGASSIGFDIAARFSHTINPLKPALVGFTVQKEQFWFKELSGISCSARVVVGQKSFQDNILFTHKGISGPAILNASLYWERGSLTIHFLPKPLRFYLKNPFKQISSQLPLPKRFVKRFLEVLGVGDKKLEKLSSQEMKKLKAFEAYTFAPAGTFGFERAEVTKGGVLLEEVSEHLESLKIPGLFFAGEVLDVTGELGGYNFQWAFSSGVRVAQHINQKATRAFG